MTSDKSDPHAHPALTTERIPAGSYTESFLRNTQARGEVAAVPANWDGDLTLLPAGTRWLLFPNGDLQRL